MKSGEATFGACLGAAATILVVMIIYAVATVNYRDGASDGRFEANKECAWEKSLAKAYRGTQ